MTPIEDGNDYTNGNLLNVLIAEGQRLSLELPQIKTEVDKRKVEDYENRIARFRNTLKRADEMNRRGIDRLKAQRKLIEMMDDTLSTDKSEARQLFWKLHEEEKDAHKPSRPVSEQQRA